MRTDSGRDRSGIGITVEHEEFGQVALAGIGGGRLVHAGEDEEGAEACAIPFMPEGLKEIVGGTMGADQGNHVHPLFPVGVVP